MALAKKVYRVGELFEGQLTLKLTAAQKSFLAFLTHQSLKEMLEGGKPKITKTNIELTAASNNLFNTKEIQFNLAALKRKKLIYSIKVGRNKILMLNDSYFTGVTMPIVAEDYMADDYSNKAGESLVLSYLLNYACQNYEKSGMFYTDLEQMVACREELKVTHRSFRDYMHSLEDEELIYPCLSFPINKRKVTLPCMFNETLLTDYYDLISYRKRKMRTTNPDGNNYKEVKVFEGILSYSIKTKSFSLMDENNQKQKITVDEGDLIDIHYGAQTFKTQTGFKGNEWFFPNVPLSQFEELDPRGLLKVTLYKKLSKLNSSRPASIGKEKPAEMTLDEFKKDMAQKIKIFKKEN